MNLKQIHQLMLCNALMLFCMITACDSEEPADSKRTCKTTSLTLQPHCPENAMISCDHFIYSPDLTESGQKSEAVCFWRQGKKVCARITSFSFTTMALRDIEPEQFFEPGASLNYEEFSCTVRNSLDSKRMHHRSQNLQEAIAPILNYCQTSKFDGDLP